MTTLPAGSVDGTDAAEAAQRLRAAPAGAMVNGLDRYVPRLPVPPATPGGGLDAAVAEVRAAAPAWASTPPAERARLLDEVIGTTVRAADRWTRLAALHEHLDPGGHEAAEEALVGPYLFVRGTRLHRDALRDIDRHGLPRIPGPVRTRAGGQVVARVFPVDPLDRVTYVGTRADVWMDPSVRLEGLPDTMAAAYRAWRPVETCLVLGAGNASSIAPLDILHQLVVEGRVVVCKTHPAMAHLAEAHEAAMAPLVRAGVLRIVHGDGDVGTFLVQHPGIDRLHITGSDRTYEAIVYGAGPDGAERKRRDDPVLHKPFTAELGNLTPIIVVPGRWSPSDLDYHADSIATMLTNNAGFNCTTSRVIVTPARWPQRSQLLDRIRSRLAATPSRLAFYPGAPERYAAFAAAHPEAERFGDATGEHLPWMLIPDLDAAASDDPCYRVEAFCGITAETPIDAPDVPTYLERAVRFANETLWGSLNATIIVDGATRRDPGGHPAVERAIADLRYGCVSVNHWSALGFGLGVTPWGAFPGHDRTDIQSGTGFVHDPLMFGAVQKTVIRAPFRVWPKPIWFGSHRTVDRLVPELIRFEADRAPWRLAPIFAAAVRG
jgi:hypothetical protein